MASEAATPSLTERLIARIRDAGPLPFSDFMAMALYDERSGYYSSPKQIVGQKGDFFTSVSIGPLFGNLLARRFLNHWREIGQPKFWRIVECGAHDGMLANDILTTIAALHSEAFAGLEYCTVEPSSFLRYRQGSRLSGFSKTVRILQNPEEIREPLTGLIFGNEVLDALPCEVIEYFDHQWWQLRVDCEGDTGLQWTRRAMEDTGLRAATKKLGHGFPEGYRSEIRTGFPSFLKSLIPAVHEPLMLWIDYGFARDDYYCPLRSEGTLRSFSRHSAREHVLTNPGKLDLTAHVDFTALADAAVSLGGNVIEFRNQGSWLTELARHWLLSMENKPDATDLRAFQTLTHPAQLGGSFHAIELSWNPKLAASDPERIARQLGISESSTNQALAR